MFKLSRRKGSAKWQVRKRWPTDVARILPGEFNMSTGEEDKKAAQGMLPVIAAVYTRQVQEARDKLAAAPPATLSEPQALAMAANWYRSTLPQFTTKRPLDQLKQRELLDIARERLAQAEDALGRNDFSVVMRIARTLATDAGLSLDDESPDMLRLQEHLMGAYIDLHSTALARLSGQPPHEPRRVNLNATVEVEASASDPADRTLEELLKAYETDKSPRWSGSTKKGVAPVFRLLRDVFPSRGVKSITREDARAVVKLLEGLPVNLGRRKELAGLTVPQAVEKGRALGLPTIQPKTINDGYLLHIASVFNWARKEQWVTSNPFEGLSVHDTVSDAERRSAFSSDQLSTVFQSGLWRTPWAPDRRKAGDYWVPLLCLFHGLRNGEAAGLRVEDIGTDDGRPVMHLREYGERKLKTAGSRATLPIHPQLLQLGFLKYVEARRDGEEFLLFPEGTVNDRGQVGAKLGERFSAYVKSLELVGTKLGMHSFRHSFEDALRRAELAERTSSALSRRIEPGSGKAYGDGMSTRQKAEALEKVTYPGLDLSHLRPS